MDLSPNHRDEQHQRYFGYLCSEVGGAALGYRLIIIALLCVFLVMPVFSFAKDWTLNSPYPPHESSQKIYYTSFTEQPKTLDLAKSYASNEILVLAQIVEPLFEYDYFARPYRLVPLVADRMPEVRYYNQQGTRLDDPAQGGVAKTVYTIHIKPGIMYQPHPAFARTPNGTYQYVPITLKDERSIHAFSDFKYTGTRELIADDFIYEIKRLATPAIGSPIYGVMSERIQGFRAFAAQLPPVTQQEWLDLRPYPMEGLKKIDDYTFEITLTGQFTQFNYWLAMCFFAPLPWEVDRFYAQPSMRQKNITLNAYPVGTGPFKLTLNDPNRQMILDKNPNFRPVYFPTHGSMLDKKHGYLLHAGERLPMIDRAVFTLEKESIPRWSKFLQGYYDLSGISADSFDQAIQLNAAGQMELSQALSKKHMRLAKSPELSVYYLGFNMLDPVVGGQSERARLLRRAISIVIDYGEFINIFYNHRGHVAQGPLPPGIFGYQRGEQGVNPYVFRWNGKKAMLRSLSEAKALMKKAGYPGGRDPKTGKALMIHYDLPSTGGPDDKAEMDWMRKKLSLLGIDLDVRATQFNRFQEKIRQGNTQLFKIAWIADYPDPENFLFLFTTGNGKVKFGGENNSNYYNANYDKLFEEMKNRPNDATRLALIKQMVAILQRDAPWVWGMHSELFTISQQWIAPLKPMSISYATYKYVSLDGLLRTQLRQQWNQPILWPLLMVIVLLVLGLIPYVLAYRRQQREHARRE